MASSSEVSAPTGFGVVRRGIARAEGLLLYLLLNGGMCRCEFIPPGAERCYG